MKTVRFTDFVAEPMRRTGLVITGICLAFAVPALARQTTTPIPVFNQMSGDAKAEVIRAALAKMYEYFAARDAARAACMTTLFRPASQSPDGTSLGYALLVHELERKGEQRSVERIIFDIIGKECRKE